MLQPHEGQTPEFSTGELLDPVTIRTLVESNRPPMNFFRTDQFSTTHDQTVSSGNVAFWIPPAGAQKGDVVKGIPGGGFHLESSEGQRRGDSDMYIVPRDIGIQIQKLTTMALEELNPSE